MYEIIFFSSIFTHISSLNYRKETQIRFFFQEQSLTEVERRLKNSDFDSLRELADDLNRAADDAAGNILKFLDIIQYSSPSSSTENTMLKYSTELDSKQLSLQKEEIVSFFTFSNI